MSCERMFPSPDGVSISGVIDGTDTDAGGCGGAVVGVLHLDSGGGSGDAITFEAPVGDGIGKSAASAEEGTRLDQ